MSATASGSATLAQCHWQCTGTGQLASASEVRLWGGGGSLEVAERHVVTWSEVCCDTAAVLWLFLVSLSLSSNCYNKRARRVVKGLKGVNKRGSHAICEGDNGPTGVLH